MDLFTQENKINKIDSLSRVISGLMLERQKNALLRNISFPINNNQWKIALGIICHKNWELQPKGQDSNLTKSTIKKGRLNSQKSTNTDMFYRGE